MKLDKMKKEDFELLSYKDITNILLEQKGPANTPSLFRDIINYLELSDKEYESKIGDYYMMLTTDKRFVLLEDGNWDLRKRHTSDKIIIVSDEDEDEPEEELVKIKDEEPTDEDEDSYDKDNDDDFDEDEDDLKDLVVVDEDEIELEL